MNEKSTIYLLYSTDKHYMHATQTLIAVCTSIAVALSFAAQDGATPQQIGELSAYSCSTSGEECEYIIEQSNLNELN